MQVFESSSALLSYVNTQRSLGHSIGFVPTMGALHEGHTSLISRALKENESVVCSIFVNPTQFNDPNDFERYPRQIEVDLAKLEAAGCQAAFTPNVLEVFPESDPHTYKLGQVAERLEGSKRPGHFNGVASVVKRLFELVQPDKAYFGLKDYQQFLVIKAMVAQYGLPVHIVGCETVRDPDGLAKSSRNQLLSPGQRKEALHLSKSLIKVKEAFLGGITEGLEAIGVEYLDGHPELDLEYFEVADPDTLAHIGNAPIASDRGAVVLVAARTGDVRLIDNMLLEPSRPDGETA